jgi:hypothetical protein
MLHEAFKLRSDSKSTFSLTLLTHRGFTFMKTKYRPNLHQIKISAVAAAVALVAVGFAGCGGSDSAPTVTPTTIPVTGAGNSPFVNVVMTATCANGATGTGNIGATTPGDGVITVTAACTPPIKITATGKGKMRPLGALANGTQDVVYDPAVNLPISNIFAAPPAPGASVTANPVTTVVANAVTLATPVLSAVTSANITAAQTKTETALGLAAGDASNVRSYLQPLVAEASTRIVEVAALAATQASTTGVTPTGVTTTKPLGQVIAEQIAAAANAGTPMSNAAGVATAINTGTNAINVTANAAVTGAQIDSAANTVFNMVYATIASPTAPTKVSDLITSIAANTTLAAQVTTYVQGVTQAASQNTASKAVADAIAATPPSVPTSGAPSGSASSATGTSAALTAALAAAQQKLVDAQTAAAAVTTVTPKVSTTTTTTSTTTTTTTTTAAPTTTTTAAPTTTTTTAAPTTTTTTSTTAPTTTSTTTTVATTTTTTAPAATFAGVCEVKVGSAIGYMTGVASASSCVSSVLNVDGGGATVAVAPATLLAGKTNVAFASALTCDPFGAPPAAGAVTLTACKQ